MPGFHFRKHQYGAPTPENELLRINNSVTVRWGGLIRIVTSGNPTANNGVVCEDVAAGETLSFLCNGIVTSLGTPLDTAPTSEFDGTFTSGVYGAKSYAAAADNLTDRAVSVLGRPLSYHDVLRNTPDAARGTTAGATTRYNYTDTADDVSADENNAGNALTTVAQLFIWGADPDISTDTLYKPKELQDEVS